MNWLRNWWRNYRQKRHGGLLLLPCDNVLFPGGRIDLTLTDLRWRELLTGPGQEIGLCLQGKNGLYPFGTLGRIVELHGLGSALRLTLTGGERFRLLSTGSAATSTAPSDFAILPSRRRPLPERFRILLPLLRKIIQDRGTASGGQFDDADWVGFRFCEILPIPPLAKYKLLELENPITRLEILQRYLDERQLLQG